MSHQDSRPDVSLDCAELIGHLGHDFNNLLGVIRGGLSLLREEIPSSAWDPETRAVFEDVVSASQDAAEVVIKLTSWAGLQMLTPRATDLNATVAGIETLLARALPREVKLELDLDSDPVTAWVDPERLGESLLSLVSNSGDAMPHGGVVVISTRRGDAPSIRVRDTGVGMTPETLQHCREPYYSSRADREHKGLGLSVVDGFARRSAGHLEILSTPGEGTEARLVLPSAEASVSGS